MHHACDVKQYYSNMCSVCCFLTTNKILGLFSDSPRFSRSVVTLYQIRTKASVIKNTHTHTPTRLSAGRVSCKQTPRKTMFNVASVNANSAGDVKNASETSASTRACCEKYAPTRGPTMKPTENATPISAYINTTFTRSSSLLPKQHQLSVRLARDGRRRSLST